MAVAALPAAVGLGAASYHHPATFNHGFVLATEICAVLLAVAAVLAGALVSNDVLRTDTGGGAVLPEGRTSCSVAAPPLEPARKT